MSGESPERTISMIRHVSQFWVSCSPFFETTLFFSPSILRTDASSSSSDPVNYDIKLYDADGEVVNQLQFQHQATKLGVLELHSLMEAIKYESGIKHGWVNIESEHPARIYCRLHSRNTATLMGELQMIGGHQRVCFPLSLGEQRSSYLAVVNFSKESAAVRCKLFVGKRSPEVLFSVPSAGARIINLESEFPEFRETKSPSLMGYIRVSPRNDSPFGVQLIERIEGAKEEGLFGTLT